MYSLAYIRTIFRQDNTDIMIRSFWDIAVRYDDLKAAVDARHKKTHLCRPCVLVDELNLLDLSFKFFRY